MIAFITALALAVSPPPPKSHEAMREIAQAKERACRALLHAGQTAGRSGVGVDVRRYDIDLCISPQARQISGFVRMRADVREQISTCVLDMNSTWLAVDSIIGPIATWSLEGGLLALDLDHPHAAGETLEVRIHYHGSPSYTSFGIPFFGQRNGVPLIATLSEPFGARNWWPCKDQPDDKADTVSMTVTVPSDLEVASNGRSLGIEPHPDGTTTHRWIEEYPIATYLVSLAICDYETIQEWYVTDAGDSVPVVHYLYTDLAGNADAFAVTVPAMGDLSSRFGPYPFPHEKYGHALFQWGGAMEHQTCTTMGEWAAYGGWEWIIVHELAHQWWGDLVTCASFHHVWLNEGFATYGEAVWQEVEGGMDAYHAAMAGDQYYGGGTIYVENPETDEIFGYGLSYQKAAYVLHMLRHVVGDSLFFGALLEYRDRFAYASATTEGFRDAVEDVAGLDLDEFFQQWIYGAYFPRYEYGWTCVAQASGWATRIRIEQVQTNTGLFSMPVDVRVALADGEALTNVVWVRDTVTEIDLVTDRPVVAVELDPDGWILCQKEEVPLTGDEPVDPTRVRLEGPWPNPGSEDARLVAWAPCPASLSVSDLTGRRRLTIPLEGGRQEVRLGSIAPLPSGVYLVRLEAACGRATRTMVVR